MLIPEVHFIDHEPFAGLGRKYLWTNWSPGQHSILRKQSHRHCGNKNGSKGEPTYPSQLRCSRISQYAALSE